MSIKAILVLCAQALLLKCALGQSCTSHAAVADISGLAAPYGLAAPAPCGLAFPVCAGHHHHQHHMDLCPYDHLAYLGAGYAGRGLAYDGIYAPALEVIPTSGGALPVSSASAIAPIGLSVVSDNVYEGALAVGGELPFVGTVGLEVIVPSAGAGAVNHACGNGRNAMISETAAYGTGAAFAPAAFAAPGFGLHGGWAGRGCSCAI